MVERGSIDYRNRPHEQHTANYRLLLVSLLAAGIGIIAGLIAFVLYHLIGLFTNLFFFQRVSFGLTPVWKSHVGLWVIIIPVIGGVIVGIMAKYGSSKIKGHGIPEAMEAVLINRSRISPRVAILKPLSAAIAIGTGGPFGAEGPIIQTGGAMGSIVGQIIRTTAAERKVLLGCGAAAGMSATFSTPIAGVILAIELLMFEFRARSFIPLVIASTLATSVHFMLMGRGPMFTVATVHFAVPEGLPYYVLLGLVCGLAAVLFSNSLYRVEDMFERLPLDDLWWPAIGGLGLGIIGYFVPRVLGVGYDTISDILNNQLGWRILLALVVFKSLALLVSLGSGTSGGLLAPMFMVGGALGGCFAIGINSIYPGAHLDPGAFAIAGMAAVFAAASRAVFTFIIFAFELTRNYNSVLPLMLACVIADGVGLLLMQNSIMTEKLVRRGLRIHQDYEADVFQQAVVMEAMDRDYGTIPADMSVGELERRLAQRDRSVTRHNGLFLVDAAGDLLGVITRSDIIRALEDDPGGKMTVLQAGSINPVVAYPDEPLYDAVARMLRNDIGRMPVIARENSARIVGYLGRREIMAVRLRRLEEESVREPGWTLRRPRGISAIHGSEEGIKRPASRATAGD